jgi:hypothetical protein
MQLGVFVAASDSHIVVGGLDLDVWASSSLS